MLPNVFTLVFYKVSVMVENQSLVWGSFTDVEPGYNLVTCCFAFERPNIGSASF